LWSVGKNKTKEKSKMLALYSRYLGAKDALKRMISRDEEGQGIVEYILLIVFIALIVFATIPGLAGKMKDAFNAIGNSIQPGAGS
jgi:Flp pilus assembly pilin Flp